MARPRRIEHGATGADVPPQRPARRAARTRLPNGTYAPSVRALEYSVGRARDAQRHARRRLELARQYRGAHRDRYRDMSAIVPGTCALTLWRDCVRLETERLQPNLAAGALERNARRVREILSIHGTAHTATEVVQAPGRTYIRGAMIHDPSLEPGGNRWRPRDHVRRPLEPGRWYLAVRNTVPRASADTRGRR